MANPKAAEEAWKLNEFTRSLIKVVEAALQEHIVPRDWRARRNWQNLHQRRGGWLCRPHGSLMLLARRRIEVDRNAAGHNHRRVVAVVEFAREPKTTGSAMRRATKATQLPSRPYPPPVSQNGPMGSPWTTGEWLFMPLTASPKISARLAFQPKLSPQLNHRARVRR